MPKRLLWAILFSCLPALILAQAPKKDRLTLDQAKNEIHGKLQNDRTREMMDKVSNSFKVETNEAYFGPGGVGTAPPSHLPRPRQVTPAAPGAQPQTAPPAEPPAAKPN